MTRAATLRPPSAEIDAILESVDAALLEERFDRSAYQDALKRVADAGGDFADNQRVHEAAAKAGLIPSVLSRLKTPGKRWDQARRAFVDV